MKLRVNFFDLSKYRDLMDSNEYLQKVLIPVSGEWVIETDDIREIERLLKSKRIKYSIQGKI